MNHTKKYLVLVIFIFSFTGFSQQSELYVHDDVAYQKAVSLFTNKQYFAAQSLFETVQENSINYTTKSNCAYYIANCAVRLNQQDADTLMEDFVTNYPTSIKRNTAYIEVGNYYFNQGKYAYAAKWYEKADTSNLSIEQREAFNFNYGYASYTTKQYKIAKEYLAKVEYSEKYGSKAKYYIGYMAYQDDNYAQANEYFEQVEDAQYKEKLSYYQADLNFKLGNFEKAIELAQEQLPKSNEVEVSELHKIIGESYFNLEQYGNAIPHLKAYQGKNGKWNNTDYYQLGYAYYKQNDFENAVGEFNKIIEGSNAVAQNAYYHLGESYIHLNKKQEALNAFRNASQMDYDLAIQKDAWTNYAKLSYEIGNPYQPVPQVLTTYLNTYPKSTQATEIEQLLIDSYITSKNYTEALRLLEGRTSKEYKQAYQKVAFYRGLELYNEGNYTEANELFTKAVKQDIDPFFTARATYWSAETNYNLLNFKEALTQFEKFKTLNVTTPETVNLYYQLAYTSFKLKDYTKAQQYFNTYLNTQPTNLVLKNDAYLRLGDAYFAASNYGEAIKAYQKAIAIGKSDVDYAYFQKAMSLGFLGQTATKNNELETFIKKYPNSKFKDDALFELGNSYLKTGLPEKSIDAYNRLITQNSNSPFVSNALLKQGLVYYNQSKNEKALQKFKKVAKEYPNTPDASQAVSMARLIYIDEGKIDDYAAWVKTLNYIQVTNTDLDNTTYEAAEKQYLDNKTQAAIKLFVKYIADFPSGLHNTQAHFYLAELYEKEGRKEDAAIHYEHVVTQIQNEFNEEALSKLAQIYLDQKKWKEVIPVLKRLENESNSSQNTLFAQSNLMKASYEIKDYNTAQSYATVVLSNAKTNNKIKSDAQLIIARSAMQTNNFEKAKEAYANVQTIATGETRAEALYYKAFFENNEQQYETSNKTIQELVKDYSAYKYYSAKGLVVMAKNYDALNDAFQATYILQSVVNNFSEFADVVLQAQETLNTIKAEQAKSNASVQD